MDLKPEAERGQWRAGPVLISGILAALIQVLSSHIKGQRFAVVSPRASACAFLPIEKVGPVTPVGDVGEEDLAPARLTTGLCGALG